MNIKGKSTGINSRRTHLKYNSWVF